MGKSDYINEDGSKKRIIWCGTKGIRIPVVIIYCDEGEKVPIKEWYGEF